MLLLYSPQWAPVTLRAVHGPNRTDRTSMSPKSQWERIFLGEEQTGGPWWLSPPTPGWGSGSAPEQVW